MLFYRLLAVLHVCTVAGQLKQILEGLLSILCKLSDSVCVCECVCLFYADRRRCELWLVKVII